MAIHWCSGIHWISSKEGVVVILACLQTRLKSWTSWKRTCCKMFKASKKIIVDLPESTCDVTWLLWYSNWTAEAKNCKNELQNWKTELQKQTAKVNYKVNYKVNWKVNCKVNWKVNWKVNCKVNCKVNWKVNCKVNWKVNCKVNCRSVVELRNEPQMKNGVGVYLRATVGKG